jgi:hypothetical protein
LGNCFFRSAITFAAENALDRLPLTRLTARPILVRALAPARSLGERRGAREVRIADPTFTQSGPFIKATVPQDLGPGPAKVVVMVTPTGMTAPEAFRVKP